MLIKARKTIRTSEKPPKVRSVDVTGMKLYMPPSPGQHAYFKKGGKYNP